MDPIINTITGLEFENVLRMVVLSGGCWYPYGSFTWPWINFKSPLGCGLLLGQRGCHLDPFCSKFQLCWALCIRFVWITGDVVLRLNWVQDPSLNPRSLEFQMLGRWGFNSPWARWLNTWKMGFSMTWSLNPGPTQTNQTKPCILESIVQTVMIRKLDYNYIYKW